MTDTMFELLVLGNLAPTLMMTGLIWFVQIVHYPLFQSVDAGGFPAYERDHTRLTTFVVGPLMWLEGVCAAGLLFAPAGVAPRWAVWSGFVLVLALWAMTAAVQVPCHTSLSKAFDARFIGGWCEATGCGQRRGRRAAGSRFIWFGWACARECAWAAAPLHAHPGRPSEYHKRDESQHIPHPYHAYRKPSEPGRRPVH